MNVASFCLQKVETIFNQNISILVAIFAALQEVNKFLFQKPKFIYQLEKTLLVKIYARNLLTQFEK